MNKTQDAVDEARSKTQDLYRHIRESTAKNHAAIRDDFQTVASSLKTLARDRQADQKQHLEHAALLLEQAAANAKSLAAAGAADVREANMAMLQHTRDALQDMSYAIAAKRAAFAKQHAKA